MRKIAHNFKELNMGLQLYFLQRKLRKTIHRAMRKVYTPYR